MGSIWRGLLIQAAGGIPRLLSRRITLAGVLILLTLLFTQSMLVDVRFLQYLPKLATTSQVQSVQDPAFVSLDLYGFDNGGSATDLTCGADRLKSGVIGVQPERLYLTDNLYDIAETLDSHELISYNRQAKGGPIKLHGLVDKMWARLAASCLLLPKQQVHLCVSRVIFYEGGKRDFPTISFLRGQIFDLNWQHMDNHTIRWNEKTEPMTFPLIFDIPTDYDHKSIVFGPEDPRIIQEEGLEFAEPLIIFNMKTPKAKWKRAMFIYRPFSGHTVMLTIAGRERPKKEKNWAPFFISDASVPAHKRTENKYVHFVYNFRPLEVLRCHLDSGNCDVVFTQKVPLTIQEKQPKTTSTLRGGTPWMPVPLPRSLQQKPIHAFVSFPRTNLKLHCGKETPFYRPEMVIMVTDGIRYFFSHASDSIDFGPAVLEPADYQEPCKGGRILIANSITSWDTTHPPGQDIMTITFTVGDQTVQVARVIGVLKLIQNLPSYQRLFARNEVTKVFTNNELFNDHSMVGDHLRSCLEIASEGFLEAQRSSKSSQIQV